MAYQVNEIFTSIQGEGVMAGVPSTFIRLQGCPVGCHWCDSVRTWGPGHITNEYRRGYLSSTLIGLNPVSPEFVAKMEDGLDLGEVYNPDSYEFKRGFIAGVHDATAQWHTHGLGLHIPDNNVILRGRVIDILKEQSIAVGRTNDAIIVDTIDVQTFQDYYQPMLHVKGFSKPRINGVRMEVEDIAKQVYASNVVITGGEPMLYNLDELIGRLRAGERKPNIQIETSGLCDYKGKLRADHMTISPKEKLGYKVPIDLLATVAEIKFVVDDRFESHVVDDLVAEVRGIGRTYVNFVLMPEGSPPSPANISKALSMVQRLQLKYPTYRWRFGARLQYWLGVR